MKNKKEIKKIIFLIASSLFFLILIALIIFIPKFFSKIIMIIGYSFFFSILFLLFRFTVNKFVIKKERPLGYYLNVLLSAFILIFIMISISTFIFAIPSEPRGINLKPFEFKFSFYIVNNEISQGDLQKYIFEANKIWNKYNYSILAKEIENIKINITAEERHLLYTNISSEKNVEENEKVCDKSYMPLINKITNNNPNMSIIFINGDGSSGRGKLCGYPFVIFKKEKNRLIDLTGWNLAHEIGHVWGLGDLREANKMNLMNDKYKILYKISSKTIFLNQEQIERVMDEREIVKNS